MRDDLASVGEIAIRRRFDFVRGVSDQPRNGNQENDHRGSHRSAQKPRRLAVQRELPPQIVRVLHVLEGKEPEPHRRGQRRDDSRRPGRGEARHQQCRLAIEHRARATQHEKQEAEHDGFLVVHTFQERCDDAGGNDDRGQVVRGVQSSR